MRNLKKNKMMFLYRRGENSSILTSKFPIFGCITFQMKIFNLPPHLYIPSSLCFNTQGFIHRLSKFRK